MPISLIVRIYYNLIYGFAGFLQILDILSIQVHSKTDQRDFHAKNNIYVIFIRCLTFNSQLSSLQALRPN